MSQVDRFGPRYHIASISNPEACAGQTLTIRGTGFGPTGRVSFPSPGSDDPAFGLGAGDDGVLGGVIPTRWTDTEIDVVVPAWATAGELHLNAYTRHRDPCATIDVYRLGNSVFFQGGLSAVYQVSLGGVDVALDGKVIAQAPLVALDAVPQGGFFKRLWDSLLMWWHAL